MLRTGLVFVLLYVYEEKDELFMYIKVFINDKEYTETTIKGINRSEIIPLDFNELLNMLKERTKWSTLNKNIKEIIIGSREEHWEKRISRSGD